MPPFLTQGAQCQAPSADEHPARQPSRHSVQRSLRSHVSLSPWPAEPARLRALRVGGGANPAEFLDELGKLRQLGHYYACWYSHCQLAL